MTVIKEIRFSTFDVRELAIEAMKKAAIASLGELKDNEEMDVKFSDYGPSIVTIQTKQNEEIEEVNK